MDPYWFMKYVYAALIIMVIITWIVVGAMVKIRRRRPNAPDVRPLYLMMRYCTGLMLVALAMLGALHYAVANLV